jgi:hypothetical protein
MCANLRCWPSAKSCHLTVNIAQIERAFVRSAANVALRCRVVLNNPGSSVEGDTVLGGMHCNSNHGCRCR